MPWHRHRRVPCQPECHGGRGTATAPRRQPAADSDPQGRSLTRASVDTIMMNSFKFRARETVKPPGPRNQSLSRTMTC